MYLIVSGQVPAQKNKHISWYNKRTGRVVNTTHSSVLKWKDDVAKQLLGTQSITGRVRVEYMFYCKDRRRRDIDNMIASINDALVKAGIVEDDCWQKLKISGADAALDTINPRVELDITGIRDAKTS